MPIAYPYRMSDWYGYSQDCVSNLKQIYLTVSQSLEPEDLCGALTSTTIYYHNGTSTLPDIGDDIYSDQAGTAVSWLGYKGVQGVGATNQNAVITLTVNTNGRVQAKSLCT